MDSAFIRELFQETLVNWSDEEKFLSLLRANCLEYDKEENTSAWWGRGSFKRERQRMDFGCRRAIADFVFELLPIPVTSSHPFRCCGWNAVVTIVDYRADEVERELKLRKAFLSFLRTLARDTYYPLIEEKWISSQGNRYFKKLVIEETLLPINEIVSRLSEDKYKKLSNFLDFLKIADLLECNYRKRSVEYNILGEKIEEENVETIGEAIYYWCENCHCFLLEHSESARRKILLDLYRYFEKWNR
jgi:hypothetical protein